MYEGFDELNILRSISGAKFTTVSRQFVTSSSSSVNNKDALARRNKVFTKHGSRLFTDLKYGGISFISL